MTTSFDAAAECGTPEAEPPVMTLAGTKYAAAMAWVEQLVAQSTKLQSTKYEFYTLNGQLWVQVEGGSWAAHAWHVAVGGYMMPSHIDKAGVRRQLLLGTRVHAEIIEDPRKRGESDG